MISDHEYTFRNQRALKQLNVDDEYLQ